MKKTYYLFNPGRLSRRDNTLKFVPIEDDDNGIEREGQPRYIPVESVDQFYVFGSLDANSALYNFMGQNNIALHFFDYYENYTGSFMPRDSLLSGRMILAQTIAFQDKKKRMEIARQFVRGASFNMQKNLQYYNRRGKDMEPLMTQMQLYANGIDLVSAPDELMGIEGNIRQVYYDAFNLILNCNLPLASYTQN